MAPWAGNPDYDAAAYEWSFSIDPERGVIDATSIMHAVASSAAEVVVLDFSGPSPKSVTLDGSDVAFDYQPPKLTVQAELDDGQKFELGVVYEGMPEPIKDGGRVIRGLVQQSNHLYTIAAVPGDTSSWAPLNDSPRDPAVFSMSIETPPGMTGFASGIRRSDGTSVWETNLAVSEFGFAVGEFATHQIALVNYPIVTVSAPEDMSLPAEAVEESLPGILRHLESFLGPFPFPTLDLVGVRGLLGGGDSKPGMILLGSFDEELLTHELAHQWIGGSVGTASSRDTWWREGIPEYLTFVWMAGQSESDNIDDLMARVHESLGTRTRILTDVNSPQDRLDRSNYTRGALAIHALRSSMGDQAFRTALQEFTHSWAGSSPTSQDLIAMLQQNTEVDLDPVISAWIAQETVPPLP